MTELIADFESTEQNVGASVIESNGLISQTSEDLPLSANMGSNEQIFGASFGVTKGLASTYDVSQIVGGAYPSDDLPLMNGIASAGVSKYFSRSDHVHPNDNIKLNTTDRLTNLELEDLLK